MENIEEIGTLIKFGKYENLLRLQNEGILYMNNLPYFWEIEDKELRGDPFDCAKAVVQGPKITLGNQIVCRNYTMKIHPNEPEKINIFCMYSLRPSTFPVDGKNFRFGDYALVLIKPDEFMQRIESNVKSQQIKFGGDLVEYVSNEYMGNWGPFRKFKKFSYQSEWRLVCYGGEGKPREIRIGDIRGISAMIRSDEINKEIKIDYT